MPSFSFSYKHILVWNNEYLFLIWNNFRFMYVGGQHEYVIPSYQTLQVSLNFLSCGRKSLALHFNGRSSCRKIFDAGIVCESSLCPLNDLVCVFAAENSSDCVWYLDASWKAVKRKLFYMIWPNNAKVNSKVSLWIFNCVWIIYL